MSPKIEPQPVAELVETFVDRTLDSAAKYDNSKPLDASNVYDLHTLAAQIYALGYEDGARTAAFSIRQQHNRDAQEG